MLEKEKLYKEKKEFEAERVKHIEAENILFEKQEAIDTAARHLLRRIIVEEFKMQTNTTKEAENEGQWTYNWEDDGANNAGDAKAIVFVKPDETATYHIKPLYIKAHVDGVPINRVLVDNGERVNLIPYSSLKKAWQVY